VGEETSDETLRTSVWEAISLEVLIVYELEWFSFECRKVIDGTLYSKYAAQ